ncbi:MAG: hypothetical protein RBU37_13600 [Myxococcota bacterium]|jgi:hypothetical protein|nr:hypothetical protein [Myxococcota bacterium]
MKADQAEQHRPSTALPERRWRRWLFAAVLEEVRESGQVPNQQEMQSRGEGEDLRGSLAPQVLRYTARRVSILILKNWATCWDPIHINGVKWSMEGERRARAHLSPLINAALKEILHGQVLSLQQVLRLVDEASDTALGKCVCRVSGAVQDSGVEHSLVRRSDANPALLWSAIVEASRQTRDSGRTDAALCALIDELRHEAPELALSRFWSGTYPYWEILLTHRDFTPEWKQNMLRHRKAYSVHPSLLKAVIHAHYADRATVFTGMEMAGARYAICSCPGPERGGGCSLISWYYHSRHDNALQPNCAEGARARDENGNILPCQRFPSRASRPCLGCGCKHD